MSEEKENVGDPPEPVSTPAPAAGGSEPAPADPTPATPATPAAPADQAAPVTPPAAPTAPAGPPIDFAMPAPKRPMTVPKHLGCMVKMIFGFGVMLLMGYFALMALNPKARQWALQGDKDGSGGPTPFKAMNQVLAIPAQAMGKTDDVVKANNARVGQLDGLIAEDEANSTNRRTARIVSDPFATPTPAAVPGNKGVAAVASNDPQAISREALLAMSDKLDQIPAGDPSTLLIPPASIPPGGNAQPEKPPPPTQVTLAGGVVITNASPEGTPLAESAFFYSIVNLNISGVFQSGPHRMLVNGRLTYAGDEINRALGITFERLDLENKLLIFRDKTGAIVTRSY